MRLFYILVISSVLSLNIQANENWLPKCDNNICGKLDSELYRVCEDRKEAQIPVVADVACVCDCTVFHERNLEHADTSIIGKNLDLGILPVYSVKTTKSRWTHECVNTQESFSYTAADGWFIETVRFNTQAKIGNADANWELNGPAKILTHQEIGAAYDYARNILQQEQRRVNKTEIERLLDDLQKKHTASRRIAGKVGRKHKTSGKNTVKSIGKGYQAVEGEVYANCTRNSSYSEIRTNPVVTMHYIGYDLKSLKRILKNFVKVEVDKRTRITRPSKLK